MSKHNKRAATGNPYERDAVGGGVGGRDHGLIHVAGAVQSACPATKRLESMRYELPDGVSPAVIHDTAAWRAWSKERAAA